MSYTPRDLTHFAGELRLLAPLPGHLDRDQLMFRAGQATVPRPSRLWPVCTGLLSAACLTLGAVVAFRSEPAPVERVVYVQVPKSATIVVAAQDERPELKHPPAAGGADAPTEESPYLRYRDQVIRWGPDALPRGALSESYSRAGDLRYQLDMPPNTLRRGTLIGGQAF